MIVLVGRYPTIPLEMSTEIVYGPPTDSPVCGIAWNMCTRERWDPNRPYDIVAKGYHTWPVHRHTYVVLVKLIPLQGWLLIRISMTILGMSDSLFTSAHVEMHVYHYDDGLRWLINNDDYYIMMLLYFTVMIVILNILASGCTFIQV
jgi:hypothetical protein